MAEYRSTADCSCSVCQDMCNRPCWPTPTEAKTLMDEGYRSRMMADYWVGSALDDEDVDEVEVLCGASPGAEGSRATYWPTVGCAFHNDEGLCDVHHIKPAEGRAAIHGEEVPPGRHQEIAALWQTEEGRALVERFHAERA